MKEKKKKKKQQKKQQQPEIQNSISYKKNVHDSRFPCPFVIYGKHAIYFSFLKQFIDISFVKTVRCIIF